MKKFVLAFTILLGLFLRVYKLDIRPLGFTWDEAAIGYNAYSLIKTGRDEWGARLPVIFKSFGDYKPGLYIYTAVPAVKLLGLTEFATRLPSALFGTLLIVLIYLLAKQLRLPPVTAAFLLSVNPWAIHFSRGAWEANLALLLTTLGALLFLKRNYFLSFLFFALTLWSYQGAKLFTPLLLLILLILVKPNIKKLILPGLVFCFILTPVVLNFFSQSQRLTVLNVFNYSRPAAQIQEIIKQDQGNGYFLLFHSEMYDQIRGVVLRYLNHFSPRFIFMEGDWSDLRQTTPFYGYLHLPEIVTVLIGLAVLLKSKTPASRLLLSWLLLAPLPSALSRDIISGVRSLPMIVPLVIISGIGLSHLLQKKLLWFLITPVFLYFMGYYLILYYVNAPFYSGEDWLSVYKPALALVKNNINSYKKVYFTNTLGQPYIFVLFYYQVDPRIYQHQAYYKENSSSDAGEITRFDKFYFEKVDWPAHRGDSSTLFVGNRLELPDQDMNPPNLVRLGEVNYPDGKLGLRLIGLK